MISIADAIEVSKARARKAIVGRPGVLLRELIEIRARVGQELMERAGIGQTDDTYTFANYKATAAVLDAVIEDLHVGLKSSALVDFKNAATLGVESPVKFLNSLESKFTGLVRPLAIDKAAILSQEFGKTKHGALIRSYESSWKKYGSRLTKNIEKELRYGFIAKEPVSKVVDRVQDATGNQRWDVWRLVRTENAEAYNASAYEALEEIHEEKVPDLKKKIKAVWDKRTASDSKAVDGQVRGLKEMFVDGEGRRYLYPPARPHDREMVIPWRDAWPDE